MRTLPLLLLLPVVASAGDRLSFITVDQDNQYTALSTITCKIRASRLPPTWTFSGTVDYEFRSNNESQVGYSNSVPFEVSPAAPTYTETSEGDYWIQATLVEKRVLVVLKFKAPLSPDDLVFCNARINAGPRVAPIGLVYAANLQYSDQTLY
jgi:hypothetical protein